MNAVIAELKGSEKQIKWANDIRVTAFNRIDQVINVWESKKIRFKATVERVAELDKQKKEEVDKLENLKFALGSVTSARWWIDNSRMQDWADIETVMSEIKNA